MLLILSLMLTVVAAQFGDEEYTEFGGNFGSPFGSAPGSGAPGFGGSPGSSSFFDYNTFGSESKEVPAKSEEDPLGNFGLFPTLSERDERTTASGKQGSPLPPVDPTESSFSALPEFDPFIDPIFQPVKDIKKETIENSVSKGSCYWNDEVYPAASRVDHGSFWYECIDLDFVPKGCFSDTGERLFFGQTFNTSNGYLMKCGKTDNGTFHIYPVGCLHNGIHYTQGNTFQDDFYWYTCIKRGEAMAKIVSGCINNEGERINPGATLRVGQYLYSCSKSLDDGNGMWLEPVACIHYGKRYEVNEKIIDGLFWLRCSKKSDDFIISELSGCVYGNTTLNDGQKYYLDGFVYRCEKDNLTTSFVHTLIGCLETDQQSSEVIAERSFGEAWAIGHPPFMLMTKCERLGSAGASQTLTECLYRPPIGGTSKSASIGPGCYKIVETDLMIMCMRRADGSLSFDQAHPSEMDKVRRRGLVKCD